MKQEKCTEEYWSISNKGCKTGTQKNMSHQMTHNENRITGKGSKNKTGLAEIESSTQSGYSIQPEPENRREDKFR